jgi:tRNA G18 (ribose-2'-O)-methylase SpoU
VGVPIVAVDDAADLRLHDYAGLRGRSPTVADGWFVAEGALAIRHLLDSPYPLRSLLLTERGLRQLGAELGGIDAPVYVAGQDVVDTVAGFHYHRGALAAADRLPPPDPRALAAAADLVLVAEGLGDHENLGALFRNAAAFGVGAVLLDPRSGDPLSRRCVRVSMGHAVRVPNSRLDDWPAGLGMLSDLGYEVLALAPSASADDLRSVGARPRQALLVGSEGAGLSEAAMAAAARTVRIAMAPGVDSLNVATAAAVALHHLTPRPADR